MAIGNNFSLGNLKPNKIPTTLQGNILIYGNPKSGKTSTVYNLYKDKAIFLAFERGYLFVDGIIAVDMAKPSDVQKIVRELKKDEKKMFNTVVFDTLDIFAKMYEHYTCQINNVQEIKDIAWGGGWDKWEEECNKVIIELMRSGYNLAFISHATAKSMTKYNNEGNEVEYEKMIPTAKKRILNLVTKFCDHVFYISQERTDGKEVRYINTRECEQFQAGSRLNKLPAKILLDAQEIQNAIKKAVESEENTTDEEIKPIVFEEVDFDEIKQEVIDFVMNNFVETDYMDKVKNTIESVLGLGATINDTIKGQEEALEIILLKLQDLAEELDIQYK